MSAINQAVKAVLRKRGIELRRESNLGAFLHSRDCDLVVDVGANTGQFATELRTLGYLGHIQSVEPLNGVVDDLRANAAKDPRWGVVHCALGAEQGELQINVSRNTVYSSFMPQTDLAEQFDASDYTHTQPVKIDTLDNLMRGFPCKRPFVKIDTQGFEQQVLAGGPETLKRCVGLMVELPVEHLYQGVWSYTEALCHMERLGFLLAQQRLVNNGPDGVSALEYDCVFRRA